MKPKAKTTVLVLMFLGSFAIWSLMAYLDAAQRSDYLKFVVSIATGVVALALREMQAPAQSQAPHPVPPSPALPASTNPGVTAP